MGLNDTPVSERIQIGFFGCVNAGKSSLINSVSGQKVSVVSEKKGTTTDPVIKTMEMGELGPVVLIDTPGLNDDSDIGELRVKRSEEMFGRADMIVVVVDAQKLVKETDVDKNNEKEYIINFIEKCRSRKKPHLIALNKTEEDEGEAVGIMQDLLPDDRSVSVIQVNAVTGYGIDELKESMIALGKSSAKAVKDENKMVSDLIKKGDTVILVIPIDESAPKGRLILPQQQVIRDVLDAGGNAICIKDTELKGLFDDNPLWYDNDIERAGDMQGKIKVHGMRPALVITDSQVFGYVADIVPEYIPLTSFSIIMARYKGALKEQVEGAKVIDSLEDGDTVLVAEGCTHHRHCEDIGTVKLPAMLKKYTGKDIRMEASSGHGYPEDLSKYKLILHCGGCMLGEQEIRSRMDYAHDRDVPITNYGISIAYMSGILARSVAPLPEIDI